MDKEQLKLIKELAKEFNDDAMMQIKTGGKSFDYVKGHYVIQRLIDVFGIKWSATTIGTPLFQTDEVSGKKWLSMGVRLTIDIDGKDYSNDGWDSVEVKTFTDTFPNGKPNPKAGCFVDLGNNYKQVYTQALKKAATQLGVALYLYFGGANIMNDMDPIPDGDPFESEEEAVTTTAPAIIRRTPTNVPAKPTWGGPTIERKEKSAPPTEDSFFEAPPTGRGVGITKGPGSEVSATATMSVGETGPVPYDKPPIFTINAVKNYIKDLIRSVQNSICND